MRALHFDAKPTISAELGLKVNSWPFQYDKSLSEGSRFQHEMRLKR